MKRFQNVTGPDSSAASSVWGIEGPETLSHTPKVAEHVRVTFGTGMIAKVERVQLGGVPPARELTMMSSAQGACFCAGSSRHLQGFMVPWGSLSPRDFPRCRRIEEARVGCRVQKQLCLAT